jgi:16S rRNA (guanine527-N7)-methyltransferase
MDFILKYFPGLSTTQIERLSSLFSLYKTWNARINVISRKDLDAFYLHHVLHSLAITRVIDFNPGSKILDAGTGGGFPGVPLAIYFPEVKFHLVDSIGKKIMVVNEVAAAIGLENVSAEKARVEDLSQTYDFVVSRAVKSLDIFYPWVSGRISRENKNKLSNGILYLKGGDVEKEINMLPCKSKVFALSDYYNEDYFSTKYLLHLYH